MPAATPKAPKIFSFFFSASLKTVDSGGAKSGCNKLDCGGSGVASCCASTDPPVDGVSQCSNVGDSVAGSWWDEPSGGSGAASWCDDPNGEVSAKSWCVESNGHNARSPDGSEPSWNETGECAGESWGDDPNGDSRAEK